MAFELSDEEFRAVMTTEDKLAAAMNATAATRISTAGYPVEIRRLVGANLDDAIVLLRFCVRAAQSDDAETRGMIRRFVSILNGDDTEAARRVSLYEIFATLVERWPIFEANEALGRPRDALGQEDLLLWFSMAAARIDVAFESLLPLRYPSRIDEELRFRVVQCARRDDERASSYVAVARLVLRAGALGYERVENVDALSDSDEKIKRVRISIEKAVERSAIDRDLAAMQTRIEDGRADAFDDDKGDTQI